MNTDLSPGVAGSWFLVSVNLHVRGEQECFSCPLGRSFARDNPLCSSGLGLEDPGHY